MENLRLYFSDQNYNETTQKSETTGHNNFEQSEGVSRKEFSSFFENGKMKQNALSFDKENIAISFKSREVEKTESLLKKENVVSFQKLKERMRRIGR